MSISSTPSSKLVASVVAVGLAPLLKSNGFRKHRHHFVRNGQGGTSHLEVQARQWNSPNRESFTINLWTYLPAIAAVNGEKPIADPVRQKRAHCGIRIGHLLPKRGDFWWLLQGESDVERIATDVTAAVRDFGLPYLEEAVTLEGVARLSGHIPGICTDPTEAKAVALRLLGREQEADNVELAIQIQRDAARAHTLAQLVKRGEA